MRMKNPYEADKLKHGPAEKKNTGVGAVDLLRPLYLQCNLRSKKLDVDWLETTE